MWTNEYTFWNDIGVAFCAVLFNLFQNPLTRVDEEKSATDLFLFFQNDMDSYIWSDCGPLLCGPVANRKSFVIPSIIKFTYTLEHTQNSFVFVSCKHKSQFFCDLWFVMVKYWELISNTYEKNVRTNFWHIKKVASAPPQVLINSCYLKWHPTLWHSGCCLTGWLEMVIVCQWWSSTQP